VAERKTHFAVEIPWVMGLIGTHSLDGTLLGINQLVTEAEQRIGKGIIAYGALQKVRADHNDKEALAAFESNAENLGYALLLKRTMDDPTRATKDDIARAAASTIPNVPVLFWSFRLMVALGFWFIALFAYSFWLASTRDLQHQRGYLRVALYSLPLPWLAAELGWIVAEYGRQPWAIEGILPTALGVSSVSTAQVATSLAGFVLFYTVLAVVDVMLMRKYIRKGPDGLGMWRHQTGAIPDSGSPATAG